MCYFPSAICRRLGYWLSVMGYWLSVSTCPLVSPIAAAEARAATPDEVLAGLRKFFAKTARADGSFANGLDPRYRGMSDSAYSDLAAVTYAVTLHKTFGWKLPHEELTRRFLLSRQHPNGDFFNVARSEEHTSELQSPCNLVCRLLLEKKTKTSSPRAL